MIRTTKKYNYSHLHLGLLFICLTILASCNNTTESTTINTNPPKPTKNGNANIQASPLTSQNITTKTFEVKDSTGKSVGWGYDIYIENKKMIHQPIIPAIAGNNPFKTEKQAQLVGELAATKIKELGSLPTISVHELDSLGITK
jgi:hypothetical protein